MGSGRGCCATTRWSTSGTRSAATDRASATCSPPTASRRRPRSPAASRWRWTGRARAAGPGSGEDRLHRAELPRPRRRGRDRAAAGADLLRQVPQRARGAGRHRGPARGERQGRLRGRGRVRGRAPRQGRGGVRRARSRRRLHAAQRPLGPRPPVRDPAVDAGQGVRRLGALRPGAGDARRGGRPRTGSPSR